MGNIKIDDLIFYEYNNKIHNEKQIDLLANSIKEYWFNSYVVIDKNNIIIAWHWRVLAGKKLGLKEVPCIIKDDLTEKQIKKYRLLDNKIAELAEDNVENIKFELEELEDVELNELYDLDLNIEDNREDIEDEVPEEQEEVIVKKGDIFQLWNHKIICWDSLKLETYIKLLWEKKVDLWFNDPPYGMKKENEWIENDNLNYDDLLNFNKERINLQFTYLKDNWSFYCWGTDEPLMDIYSEILKPLIKTQRATFRNLITWDKENGQWQNSENTRSYAIADEKCLFVMCWVQGFNNNADNYFEGWEEIRDYFEKEIKSIWKTDWKIAQELWYKDGRTVNHWRNKSQFNFITENNYKALQDTYWILPKEYDKLKKEHDKIKKEYYKTRAYFNNIHWNFNNVWKINRVDNTERNDAGNHHTPKPIKLCSRAILSSCEKWGTVLDGFLWSWSTLIACEKEQRKCYWIEIDEKYIQVILKRYYNYVGTSKDIKCINRNLDLDILFTE